MSSRKCISPRHWCISQSYIVGMFCRLSAAAKTWDCGSPAVMPHLRMSHDANEAKPCTRQREAAPAEDHGLVCGSSHGQPYPAGSWHCASWRHAELGGACLLPMPVHPGPVLALHYHHHLQVKAAMMV